MINQKKEWRSKMEDKKENQKEFSTCLEDSSFAETMQKTMDQQRTDSLLRRFLDTTGKSLTLKRSKSRKHEMVETIMKLHPCADCPIRCRATAKPHSLFARIHRWHMTWWPGWKMYQNELHARNAGATIRMNPIKENR
jgi:hypothetical protein